MLCVLPKCGCSFFEHSIWSCISDERAGQKDGGGHTLTPSALEWQGVEEGGKKRGGGERKNEVWLLILF